MSISVSSCVSEAFEALGGADDLEHLLLLLELERQVRGDRVGQSAGVVDAGERGQDLGRNLLVEFDVLLELGNDRAAQRLGLGTWMASGSIGVTWQVKCESASSMVLMRARCVPSTSTFTVPSGSFSICRMPATQPIS